MAKEGTDDLFGFAELTGDYVPPPQPQTKDNNNKGKPLPQSQIKDNNNKGKLPDTDSIKGVNTSDNTSVESDSKSVASVAVEIAVSASTDSKTQCSVEGLTVDSGISAEQKFQNVKPTTSKFTPPTTPSKIVGKQPFSKTSPKGMSSVESSPLSKCSVVLKKNPILDKLPRQNSNENIYAYVSNDKIEIKSDTSSMEVHKEKERKLSGEGGSSVSGLNRQNSSDKKSDTMVYNANIEVRKSGRLKSSKCSSRYRGDYGIRADVYTKLASSKKEDTVMNESKLNIDSTNVIQDKDGGSKVVKVNIDNANVTEQIKDITGNSKTKHDNLSDKYTDERQIGKPQTVIQTEISDQEKLDSDETRKSGNDESGKIQSAAKTDDNSVKESSGLVEIKSSSECSGHDSDSVQNIGKVTKYTDLKKKDKNQKQSSNVSDAGEENQQRKPSVIQTRRSSGQKSSQACDVNENKNMKETSEKVQEKPAENTSIKKKSEKKETEKSIKAETKSNINARTIVKQSGCDTKVNQNVSLSATQKQRKSGLVSRLKQKQSTTSVKKKVGPKFRANLTLKCDTRKDHTKETYSSGENKVDILPGSSFTDDSRTELDHSDQFASDPNISELKNENITKTKQPSNKDSPSHNVETEKSVKERSLKLSDKREQTGNIEQFKACDIPQKVPFQSNSSSLIPSAKQTSLIDNSNTPKTVTSDEYTASSALAKSVEISSESSKPITQTVLESARNDKTNTSEAHASPSVPVFKFYKTKEKTLEKTIETNVQSKVSPETSLNQPTSTVNASSDGSVSMLESLRLRLFANAGVKAVEVVDKPKVFESKIKQPKVKKSHISDKLTASPSMGLSGSDTLSKTYSDSESNKSSIISSKSSNRSGHSTPRSSSPSSEILDEVSRTLENLQKVKQKKEKSLMKKPKKPKFSQKMFMLRSMIPKQTESDSESHSSVTTDTSDVASKSKESRKKGVEGKPKKKSDIPAVEKEDEVTVTKPSAIPIEKDSESNTLKSNKEMNKKQLGKPKPVKCHACAHIFKSKDLLKRHYPCLMRQTRKWSQNKLRPNRVFRYVERPPKEQGSKKFICLLPKSRKQEQDRPRPQLFTYPKTKFKRVKGKRRRRLYNILQGLAGKRQPKTYPHLHVNYENLTSKSQFLYNLGLFDPESVDQSSFKAYAALQKSSMHAESDQTDKENKYKLLSQDIKQDLNTSQESILSSLTDTFSDLQNAEQEFEKSQLSDFIDGKKESSSSETEAPPVLEMFGSHNNIEVAPVIDSLSDSDSNGPPLLELQFDSPTKKNSKERHFLDFVENVVRQDSVKETESDQNSAEFKISMKNIAKLKDVGSKEGASIQRHFTDFIDLQDIKSPETVEERPFAKDNVLWEKSENGEMTLAEIKEMLKPKSSNENLFSKETLLNLRSDLAKLLAIVKTPKKNDDNDPVPDPRREPSEEKSDLAKLGIDFSAHERKSLFETLENVDSNSFERQVSQEENIGNTVTEISPEQGYPDEYKSSPDYEEDLLPSTYGESDSLDSNSKGGITDNILQMLNKLEDKGSVAENMSNLLQILAENLGITNNNQENPCDNDPVAQEDAIGSPEEHSADRSQVPISSTELQTDSELIHKSIPDIIVSDSACEVTSELPGKLDDSEHVQTNKAEGMKESNLFKSITELNSIETDSDSNLGDSYDAESMSKRLAELKATSYDASASDINSDILSDSETVSSEKSDSSTQAVLKPSENKITRPVLSASPTARKYDSDILESEDEVITPIEERPRLIMKIRVPVGASFDKSDESSQRGSSSSTSVSTKSSDVSDIEDVKSEDETLVQDQSVIENDLNTTVFVESNENKSIGKNEDIVEATEIDISENVEPAPVGIVEESSEIVVKNVEGSNKMTLSYNENSIANVGTVPDFKSNDDMICDNEIMFPKKLKLNTALTIGDSFDYESDSTSSFEREVTVVPHVGMSPRIDNNNDMPSDNIQSMESDLNKQSVSLIETEKNKELLQEIQETKINVKSNEEETRNLHSELHGTSLPLSDINSLADHVETDSLNESQVLENILDMETKFPIHEELPSYTDNEINEGNILNHSDSSGINNETTTDMLLENRNPYLSDSLPKHEIDTETGIINSCQSSTLDNDDQTKISQEIHTDGTHIVPDTDIDNVLDSNLLQVDDMSIAAEVTCSEEIPVSMSSLFDVNISQNKTEDSDVDASTLGSIMMDAQTSNKQAGTEKNKKKDESSTNRLNTNRNRMKKNGNPPTEMSGTVSNKTKTKKKPIIKDGRSTEDLKNKKPRISQVEIVKSKTRKQSIKQQSTVKKLTRTQETDNSERVKSERKIILSSKRQNKQHPVNEAAQNPKTKLPNKKEISAKNSVKVKKHNVKFAKEPERIVKTSNPSSSSNKTPETMKPILKKLENHMNKNQPQQTSEKVETTKPTLETTKMDKFSFLLNLPSEESEHVAIKPILKNTDTNRMKPHSKQLAKEQTPTKKETAKPILKHKARASTPVKEKMPTTVKTTQNTDIDDNKSVIVSKEKVPDSLKPILKNKEVKDNAIDIHSKLVQDKDVKEQILNDNIQDEVNNDNEANKGNVANLPISPVIADESEAPQIKSVLKGSGSNADKEEQNKKRRISFTDYLSRAKKGDNTKTSEEQKQTKVPFTLKDENKTTAETKTQPRPENDKSPEIVIDENMYEASDNWHSFSNIKKPQERAPALKKLERSNSAKKSVSIMPSFMPLPAVNEDHVHELDLYDKEKADSKRFVSMPLTKKSDILSLEKTMDSSSSGSQLEVVETKQSPEPVEQDDVLDVFDSLFSLGDTILSLNKTLPKAAENIHAQEEGDSVSALDKENKTEAEHSSESSVNRSPSSTSVPRKGAQDKSKTKTLDVIDLTDEPERYHRALFLELNQWTLQSGSVSNITTESSGEPKSLKDSDLASFTDPGYYFGVMGNFSGSYKSRFRYNISVFEELCKDLGNKIVFVPEPPPVKSIPMIPKVNQVENVRQTDTFTAVHDEKETSFEQDSLDVTEAGNEDYMDDDYADMLAAAQMALMEEAQNQNVAQVDKEDMIRTVETVSDNTVEVESEIKAVEIPKEDVKTKTETSTGEAVDILNSLVKTLSADIDTYTSDTESTKDDEKELDVDESSTNKTQNIKEILSEVCASEMHVDEFIDNVSKLAEEVLITKESIPEIVQEKKTEEKEIENEIVEIDKTTAKTIDVEDSVNLSEIAMKNIVELNQAEIVSKTVVLETPQIQDAENKNSENEAANVQNSEEATNKIVEKSTPSASTIVSADAVEVSKSEAKQENDTEDMNIAPEPMESNSISIESKEDSVSPSEIENMKDSSNGIIISFEKDDNETADVSEPVGREIPVNTVAGHVLDNKGMETPEILSSEIADSERSQENLDVDGRVTSEDINDLKQSETDLSASENEINFIIKDSIVSPEKGKRLSLTGPQTVEEKKPSEESEHEKPEKVEISETEKTRDQPKYTQQSSLVSMDYDAISDGSFSEDERRKYDRSKSRSKAKSSERETGRKNESFSKETDMYYHKSSQQMERDTKELSERQPQTKDKGRTQSPGRTTEEFGRGRSDSWDAANYKVEHEHKHEHRKKRKKEKKRHAVYESESDDNTKRREMKKKNSHGSERVAPRYDDYDNQKESRKNRQSPEFQVEDDDLPRESTRYRRGKEFVEDNEYHEYHTTYRKGKKFVEEDEDYPEDTKKKSGRERADSYGDMSKKYGDHKNLSKKERSKVESSKQRKYRDESEERNKVDSFDARDYIVERHRKKDKRKRKTYESDDEESYYENKAKLKNRESKQHDYGKHNSDYETAGKKGKMSVTGVENNELKIKNRESENVSERRSGSYEARDSEYKNRGKENKKSRKEKDEDIYGLEQKREKIKEHKGSRSSEDRTSKQTTGAKDAEIDNELVDSGKSQKSVQREENMDTLKDTEKRPKKSIDLKDTPTRRELKETIDAGYERDTRKVEDEESDKLERKSDTTHDSESAKFEKRKNKDIKTDRTDEDESIKGKKEKRAKTIEIYTEPILSEDENYEEMENKRKYTDSNKKWENYEKENKKEKDRENRKPSENRRDGSYTSEATLLKDKNKKESRREIASDDDYHEKKREKAKRRSDSKNRDIAEKEENRKMSKDDSYIDDEFNRKSKHKKDKVHKSPQKETKKSSLKENEMFLYKDDGRDSEDLDYEDEEPYEKEKDYQKLKEHKKSKKSRDLQDFEYETKEETIRKDKAEFESEEDYYEKKRKKKEKTKDSVGKSSKYEDISSSDEEFADKKLKNKQKMKDREIKASKHAESSDSEEEYQRKHKKKKEKHKTHDGGKQIEKVEDFDAEYKSAKKKDAKGSKYIESDDEYYETKKVKDKHAKGTKHKESKYYEDVSDTELTSYRKNKKSSIDEVYETEKERKKDKKRLKSIERRDFGYIDDEKDKKKHRKRRESLESKDADIVTEKVEKNSKKHRELEMVDYDEYETVRSKKKDKKKRYSVESEEEREYRKETKKKRKISVDDDDNDEVYRKEKKKKKEKKRRKSNDSEEFEYYEEKKAKKKDKKHRKSAEGMDDFDNNKDEKKKHRKRRHSEDSLEGYGPEDYYSSKKGKIIASDVKPSKKDRNNKDSTKWPDERDAGDIYERDNTRNDRGKQRYERDFDKYNQGRLDKGDLRHALKSKKMSR